MDMSAGSTKKNKPPCAVIFSQAIAISLQLCYNYSHDEEVVLVSISYNKLWKLLIDKKMSKAALRKATGISPNTMTKLNRDEEVTLTVLCKICDVLNTNIGDIVEYIPHVTEVALNEEEA